MGNLLKTPIKTDVPAQPNEDPVKKEEKNLYVPIAQKEKKEEQKNYVVNS